MEKPSGRAEAAQKARTAIDSGAVGAVTSWGSGISHRETLRTYWDASDPSLAQKLGDDLLIAEDLTEEDWRNHWKESLTPFRAGRFLLVPAWETDGHDGEEKVIRIDPGMAFGAGDHPTTRLCVAALEELAQKGGKDCSVLDVGTGTGVLAIASAMLGFGPVAALDIDPFCYASCLRNVARNGLKGKVRTLLLSLDLLEERFWLALANVAPRQLESMAQTLADKVAPGGSLLLSGFQEDNGERVLRSYSHAFSLTKKIEEEGWLAILMTKL